MRACLRNYERVQGGPDMSMRVDSYQDGETLTQPQ